MALSSLWTSLKVAVSDVSDVQPSIHAGYSRYGTETAAVSDVSGTGDTGVSDTADTAPKTQAYQSKAAPVLACTPDTADTCKKINVGGQSGNSTQNDPDRHGFPHTEAANAQELALMACRLATFARLGFPALDAERQAKKLLIRDREHDDRRMCLECSCLTGGMGGWRCTAFRQRGARDPGLPHELLGMLQRCPVFVAGEPSTSGYYTTDRPSNGPKIPSQVNARGPWLSTSETAAAQRYHHHHANCPQCQAAGRGHTKHCGAGAALWNDYTKGDKE